MKKEELYADIKQLVCLKKDGIEDFKITDIAINKDGFSNDIAIFKLTYTSRGEHFSKEVVLKKFNRNKISKLGKYLFTKELSILNDNEVNSVIDVPHIYFKDIDKGLLLMEKIDGQTLDKSYIKNFNNIVFERFGEVLANIHTVRLNNARNYLKYDDIWKQDSIICYIDSLKNRVLSIGEPGYIPILENIREKFKNVTFSEVLNHGDYHFWNIILESEHKPHIIDWEKARISDHRFDIANTIILGYSWFGINFKEEMLKGYINVTKKEIGQLECFEALISFDYFTKSLPLINGDEDTHIRDKSFEWLKRRYELFVKHNGDRIKKAEDYLALKGFSYN